MILTVTLNAAIDKRYLVEDLKPGTVIRVKECRYSAGGKGLNVSRVAALTGEMVTATGFVGGHAGNYIIEALEKQRIKSDFVKISGESRSCINIYDEANHSQTEFLERGSFVTEAEQEEMLSKFIDLLKTCSLVTISGSVPKGVNNSYYKRLIAIAKQYNKKVILDTSGNLLEASLEARPTMIKPNLEELILLTGKEMNSEEDMLKAGISLHQAGIEIVVITLGGEGSLIVCEEGIYKAVVPRIEAVNSVGCGDSVIAGFAVGLSRGMPMVDIIRLASAISAASAMHMETGFYLNEDMEELLPRIQIIKL